MNRFFHARRRTASRGLALGALALVATAAVAVPAGAAGVSIGSSESEDVGACAYWRNPAPPSGHDEYVSVCAYQDASSYERTYASTSGVPSRQTGGSSSRPTVTASRNLCNDRTGACHRETYSDGELSDEQVQIDLDAGTARLNVTIRDCAIDVSITDAQPDEEALVDSPSLHANVYPIYSANGEVRTDGSSYGYGSATGSVCDWSDIVQGATDDASVYRYAPSRTDVSVSNY